MRPLGSAIFDLIPCTNLLKYHLSLLLSKLEWREGPKAIQALFLSLRKCLSENLQADRIYVGVRYNNKAKYYQGNPY